MPQKIHVLKIKQWLDTWNDIDFDQHDHKKKPKEYFYMFSIKASTLKALSGIQHRKADVQARQQDDEIGIQRKHDEKRSKEIREYIQYGYPWSSLTDANKKNSDFKNLQKPGWIPTAVVINILGLEDERKDKRITRKDLIRIEEDNGINQIILPESFSDETTWQPSTLHPIEVIDGQHRLWAFNQDDSHDLEIPVVAFHELDISWQAYLFWVINIKPKKINASLAFDMYPLLRDQIWLEKGEEHIIYRETRAQELIEILWSFPDSPWYQRIEMLGGTRDFVSQNAWVNALTNTFIKRWEKGSSRPGGLYGSKMRYNDEVLDWSRTQQAAFLIFLWQSLADAIKSYKVGWAEQIREDDLALDIGWDVAFCGKYSLLNTDQGVRAVLHTFNDIFYSLSEKLKLSSWQEDNISNENKLDSVRENLKSLQEQDFVNTIKMLSTALSSFDWRSSSAKSLTEDESKDKKAYRGSGGYKELRKDLLKHIVKESEEFKDIANILLLAIGK